MIDKGIGFFSGNDYVLKLTVAVVAQICKYTEND